MNPNAIVLTPEQFEQLKESLTNSVRTDLMQEFSQKQSPYVRRLYTPEWIGIREDLERKLRSDYNDGCGQWYQNQQGIYAAFKLAFRKERVTDFHHIEENRLTNFYSELMNLIDKYREGRDGKEQ